MLMKETYSIDDYEILTDNGWVDIDFVHKTIKAKKYLVLFESGKEIECADNHVFINCFDNEIMAKNLNISDAIKSENCFDVVFDVFDTGEYEEFYDLTLEKHHKYYTNGILSHNSNFLVNMASRQALNGYTPLILSLEMSEDSLCQRLDSIYSKMDINRIYFDKGTSKAMMKELSNVKKTKGAGDIIVKEFPTGNATVSDFEIFVRELQYRGIKPGPIYCDYLQLMKNERDTKARHEDLREISEKLRAFSLWSQTPMISVGQLNRCLSLDTKVEIERKGTKKEIEIKNIKVNDKIKTYNCYNIVKKVWPIQKTKVYRIKTENNKILKCSENHRFPCYDENENFIGNFKIKYIKENGLYLKTE